MMVLINRNPFAREELHRDFGGPNSCDWCGNFRTGKKGQPIRLFRYYIETDDGRVSMHPGEFCSKSCYDSYNA